MTPDPMAREWMQAVGREAVRTELESVYSHCATEIAARGPACWASGRCCNFDRAGHRLYVTGLEAAYAVARLPDVHVRPTLERAEIERAVQAGGCPFQDANLCGAHVVRPLGCRVYFCDRAAAEWQRNLSERLLAEIRAIHDRHGVEYRYGEWRSMLMLFAMP